MMVYGIYTFRDQKTQFGQIWMDMNDEVAKRGFSMMINNAEGIMGFAPADFDLYKVGEFDSENGQVNPVWPIAYLLNGRAVLVEGDMYEKQKRESIES